MNGKTIDKVKKLLALSQSPNENEAKSAMLKAQEIMAQNGISISDIPSDEKKGKRVDISFTESERKKVKTWNIQLSKVIADNFQCETYIDTKINRGKQTISFVGLEEDCKIATEVYQFAVSMAYKLWKRYRDKELKQKHSKHLITYFRHDYFRAYVEGIKKAFEEQVTEKALIIVKDALVIKRKNSLGLVTNYFISPKGAKDEKTMKQGFLDGKSQVKRSDIDY